ncbi:hypothetical protein RV16_GL001722 [Enterococcus saccharolyticus]|nr:hypothetical protein RV16_GL001722 [Enterococcus saccharolyticus]
MIGYVITLFLSPLLAYVAEYPFNQLQQGIYYFVKQQVLQKMSTIDYLTYLRYSPGELLQKIEVGATAGRNIYVKFYCCLFRELLPEVIFTLFFILFIDKKMIPLILLGCLVVFFLYKDFIESASVIKRGDLAFRRTAEYN